MIIITFILMITLLVIIEFKSHCNHLPYRLYKLSNEQLQQLNIKMISKEKNKLERSYKYQFKKIQFHICKQRFTPLNIIGQAEVYKNNRKICTYSQLPASFKTSLYSSYIEVRYPRTLSKIIYYTSTSKKTKFYAFCLNEDLLNYAMEYEGRGKL